MTASKKISFLSILKDIDTYTSSLLKTCFEKTPKIFKKEFSGIPSYVLLILFLLALLTQISFWGYTCPFSDQQYYLFGGYQILQGRIPYIDFWDCKPVGLFLLYAFIQTFDPYEYYALPIISSLFLFAGSLGLYKLASFFSEKTPAFCIAISFILISNSSFSIQDGQSEQFFVPLTIWAITLIFLQWEKIQHSFKQLFFTGCGSMMLLGIALEVKPSCVFEGILTGLFLLALTFSHAVSLKRRLIYAVLFGTIWAFIALLPTLLIIGWYAEHHYLNDWIFANIQSNPKRIKWLATASYTQLCTQHFTQTTLFLLGLITAYFFTFKKQDHFKLNNSLSYGFIILWAITTIISGASIRGGFDSFHYMLPSAPPVLIFAAILWRKSLVLKVSLIIAFISSSIPLLLASTRTRTAPDEKEYFSKILSEQPGCLFELSGFSGQLYYSLTKETENCLPTKYLFPDALFDPQYRFALPVNPELELHHILTKKPLYLIVPTIYETNGCTSSSSWCADTDENAQWERNVVPEREWHLLRDALKDYTPLYLEENGWWGLYKLKSGLMPNVTPSGVKAEPSLPIKPLPKPEENKHLKELKQVVSQWSAD